MTDEPSRFWQRLAAEDSGDLNRFGLATMKRHQALHYFTWRWNWTAAARSSQLRFLMRHSSPSAWWSAWRNPELSDAAWAGTQWSTLERRLYTFAVRLLWGYAEEHGLREVLELQEPLLGAPLPVYRGGRLISQDLANTALELRSMGLSPSSAPMAFLEVGAGYGRTAHALLSLFPRSTYTVVDIDPAIEISRWYLGSQFESNRLRFLRPGDIDAIDAGSIDIAISISSLHEMMPATVASYLRLFDRVTAGGRVYLKQWTSWLNPDDNVRMTIANYPIPHSWQRLHWARSPVQTEFTEGLWAVPGRAQAEPMS